ncbi:MAG: WbqC family protein [Bacteroidales bacterium]|nr:WbqC family protein [Bacteroidales bacterium]
MKTKLLSSTYFGPIDYFANIFQGEEIKIETEENYQKQSYRNRCSIYGANGKLDLNVPVTHNKTVGKRLKTKDALIANEFDWQKLHWKSIESAYRTSPYFEFYEDDLRPLFEKKHKFLLDLNFEVLETLQDLLQEEWNISKTKEYEMSPEGVLDLRKEFSPKVETKIIIPEYTQVFSDKYGFISNLSIFDLIFMEGTNAEAYLRGMKL